jgi:D-xylose transport system substrate-binding protein
LLGGDKTDKNAIYVKNGQLDVIRQNVQAGKIKVLLDVFIEDWSGENAYRTMKEYLNLSANDVPDVILTSYDGLAYGTSQALNEAGITSNIIITGQDAEPQAIKNIVTGKQTMTIYKPLKEMAENAVLIAIKLAHGEQPDTTTSINNLRKNVPAYLINPIAVDKSNIMETVVKDGMVKASELGL